MPKSAAIKQGLHGSEKNTNERLIYFCMDNDHCIGNTYFKHKGTHKGHGKPTDGKTENEIDYIGISRRLSSSLIDFRAHRGADVESDLYLVRRRIKLKFQRIEEPKQLYAVEGVKDKINEIPHRIKNRFTGLQEVKRNEKCQELFKNAMNIAAEDLIGRRPSG